MRSIVDKVIAIDAMGGDNAPVEIVKGSVEAIGVFGDTKIMLVGPEKLLKSELSKYSFDKNKIEIVNATEVIGFDEAPTHAIRRKKDSSLVVGLKLVKEGRAGAFVSAGSTGAILTGGTFLIGRIQGIERPAIATLIPNLHGETLLIDSGANVDCKPEYLLQFAVMGSVYAENVLGVKNPRVGLVNIGSEKEKGNTLTFAAYELLEASGLNFSGNTEAKEIPLGAIDVAVCDAFVGNVILKYSEGFAKALLAMIKKELLSGLLSKIGALLSAGAFKRLKKNFDPSEVGGAAFLGLNGLVMKAHGSSDARAIKNAVKQCRLFIENDIVAKIEKELLKEK